MSAATPEPSITINGVPLDVAQAMTVRVAMGDFLLFLGDMLQGEPEDRVFQAYRERAVEIVALMRAPR